MVRVNLSFNMKKFIFLLLSVFASVALAVDFRDFFPNNSTSSIATDPSNTLYENWAGNLSTMLQSRSADSDDKKMIVPFTNNTKTGYDGSLYCDLAVNQYKPFDKMDLIFVKTILSNLPKDTVSLIKKTERLNYLFTVYWEYLPYYRKIKFQTQIEQSPNPIEKCMEILTKLTTGNGESNQTPPRNDERSVVVYGSQNQAAPRNDERSVVVYGSQNQTAPRNDEGNQKSLVKASLDDDKKISSSSSQDYTSEEGNDDNSNDASSIDIAKNISYLILSTALSHPKVLEETTKVTDNLIKKIDKKISNVKNKAIEGLKSIVTNLIQLTENDESNQCI